MKEIYDRYRFVKYVQADEKMNDSANPGIYLSTGKRFKGMAHPLIYNYSSVNHITPEETEDIFNDCVEKKYLIHNRGTHAVRVSADGRVLVSHSLFVPTGLLLEYFRVWYGLLAFLFGVLILPLFKLIQYFLK